MRKLFIAVTTVAIVLLTMYTYDKKSPQCDDRVFAVYVMTHVEGITQATQYACLTQASVAGEAHDTVENSVRARIVADDARRQGHKGPYTVYIDGLGTLQFFNG